MSGPLRAACREFRPQGWTAGYREQRSAARTSLPSIIGDKSVARTSLSVPIPHRQGSLCRCPPQGGGTVIRPAWLLLSIIGFTPLFGWCSTSIADAPKPERYWQVDDIRPGQKGYGCTVFKGSKIERFDAEVLGVLKNVNPGRDLILMRLAGCCLEKTCVIAGMSGSPVYIDGKLVGAVSYAWPYGKEPIAGVTPFSEMVEYVAAFDQREKFQKLTQLRLREPIRADGREFDTVRVSRSCDEPTPAAGNVLSLVPLQTPLAATGFTQHSLNLLSERTRWAGIVPVQAGGAAAHIREQAQNTPLEPGSALAVAMVTGDFDMSGIGTVTHVEGDRVYGWGHPFLSIGACEFPMMNGHIHTIYPRQTVSFKMGSPIRTLGVINADVSTGIAGWLGRKPDMLPLTMKVRKDEGEAPREFRCEVVRHKALTPQLIYTALTNSVDMEGELPDELTAELNVRVELENRPPLVIHDTFSGSSYSGGRAPGALYSPVAAILNALVAHSFEPTRIKRIDCETKLAAGRISADIEAVQLDSETYSPGETLKAFAIIKPFKGTPQRVPVQLKLPNDLAEGAYTAMVCDDLTNVRATLRDSPILSNPMNSEQLLQALAVHTSVKRTNLALRVAVNDVGVALDGQALANLPPSMVEMLANSRRTGIQPLSGALVAHQPTEWVIQGSQSVKFAVVKNKRLSQQ
jgi:SpoIVB peptidase S55